MDSSITALATFFFLGWAVARAIIYPAFISPLSKIPNAHWSVPFSPLWILWARYRCRENAQIHAAHAIYGSVIRVAPNELSVNDVEGLRTVYMGGYEKGQWYSIFDNHGVPCMFSSWHSRTHSARKRMISHVYSKSTIQTSPAIHRQAEVILYDRLLPIINSLASVFEDKTGVDVHDLWNATTMDFITAYQFGLKNSSNFLENATIRRHWLALYHGRKVYPFFPQELPRFTRFFKSLGISLVPRWVDAANKELEAWTMDLCDRTVAYIDNQTTEDQDPGNEPVVLKAMLAGIEKEKTSKGDTSVLQNETLKYPRVSLASEMIDHLAAGHETSGITMTYLTWQLSRDQSLQTKLRTELLSLSPNMSLNSNSDSPSTRSLPAPKDLDALPILHAILMETLRLRAAIPGGQPRMTPHPSCTLGPYTNIPGGVRVGAQAHSVHRNAAVFPDPESFQYMRWLDGENGYTEEQRRERDRWFWAFSSGGRMCIGSNFAMHEIKLIVAAVYSNFRTYVVDDEGIEQMDGYTCGPRSNRLFLSFEKLGRD